MKKMTLPYMYITVLEPFVNQLQMICNMSSSTALPMDYRKRGMICWTKLSRFSEVPQKLFCEYKCLSLIILNNEYLCTAYGQGNTKIFPQKLRWH